MEITALRLVLRRDFVLSEYVSGDYNERRTDPHSPKTHGEKEREMEEKSPPSLVVGVAYRVRTPSPPMLQSGA